MRRSPHLILIIRQSGGRKSPVHSRLEESTKGD
jgi:hypothetical protein